MVSHVYRLLGALFFSLSLGMPAQAGPPNTDPTFRYYSIHTFCPSA